VDCLDRNLPGRTRLHRLLCKWGVHRAYFLSINRYRRVETREMLTETTLRRRYEFLTSAYSKERILETKIETGACKMFRSEGAYFILFHKPAVCRISK